MATTRAAAVAYNLRFPGQYYDSETGTTYNWMRDFDPRLGRYIESDSVSCRVCALYLHACPIRKGRCADHMRTFMDIKPSRTKKDYEVTLKAIERLMDAKRGTSDGDKLDILVTLVEAYEARHFPLDLPDPVAAIRFVMEQRGLSVSDLVPYIGKPNRVYEILSHKRPLTMAMVWKLHRGLGIPAESLIRPVG